MRLSQIGVIIVKDNVLNLEGEQADYFLVKLTNDLTGFVPKELVESKKVNLGHSCYSHCSCPYLFCHSVISRSLLQVPEPE